MNIYILGVAFCDRYKPLNFGPSSSGGSLCFWCNVCFARERDLTAAIIVRCEREQQSILIIGFDDLNFFAEEIDKQCDVWIRIPAHTDSVT